MPEAFKIRKLVQNKHKAPAELNYEHMAHTIAKIHGVSYREAMKYRESEFWLILGFENLDNLRDIESKKK